MNGLASKWKLSLTCSNCTKLFKNPIELPCKHNICEEHLMENEAVKQNTIKCVKCQEEFDIKGNDFKTNQFVRQMLDDQLCFSDEEID